MLPYLIELKNDTPEKRCYSFFKVNRQSHENWDCIFNAVPAKSYVSFFSLKPLKVFSNFGDDALMQTFI